MSDIASSITDWITKFLEAGKKVREKNPDAPAAGSGSSDAPSGGSALAGEIRAALANGGINIAIYLIGDPNKNNDKEFKRQAVVWAGNHGAFGMAGSQLKKDCAMPLSEDPG